MQRRTVIVNSGNPIGAASLIALVVLAGLIALFIWQPWNGASTTRSTTVTTSSDSTSVAR